MLRGSFSRSQKLQGQVEPFLPQLGAALPPAGPGPGRPGLQRPGPQPRRRQAGPRAAADADAPDTQSPVLCPVPPSISIGKYLRSRGAARPCGARVPAPAGTAGPDGEHLGSGRGEQRGLVRAHEGEVPSPPPPSPSRSVGPRGPGTGWPGAGLAELPFGGDGFVLVVSVAGPVHVETDEMRTLKHKGLCQPPGEGGRLQPGCFRGALALGADSRGRASPRAHASLGTGHVQQPLSHEVPAGPREAGGTAVPSPR